MPSAPGPPITGGQCEAGGRQFPVLGRLIGSRRGPSSIGSLAGDGASIPGLCEDDCNTTNCCDAVQSAWCEDRARVSHHRDRRHGRHPGRTPRWQGSAGKLRLLPRERFSVTSFPPVAPRNGRSKEVAKWGRTVRDEAHMRHGLVSTMRGRTGKSPAAYSSMPST